MFKVRLKGEIDVNNLVTRGSIEEQIEISSSAEPGEANGCAFCPFAWGTVDKKTENAVAYGSDTLVIYRGEIEVRAIQRGKVMEF